MKLIKKKYRKLRPTMDYLADEVIMAQSWKKTQNYMRTRNWYADTLSLDISAVGLHKNAKRWADEIRDEENIPLPIELIPAPKSEKWKIDKNDGWQPVKVIDNKYDKRTKNPPLRPLANIDIRDQTWATAVMLCLADAVETAQGNCSGNNPTDSQADSIYSYGNRLVCDWKEGDGWFRWGNAETYRKYYVDYQQFLKRPLDVGKFVAATRTDEENIYIISLDLSKFYDNIDRNLLIQRLKSISLDYHGDDGDEEKSKLFWAAVQKVFSWKWREKDAKLAEKLKLEEGMGLPQGLVSAGFFANAYLIGFDRQIGNQIGGMIQDSQKLALHDYCRYVDDIRLVISSDDNNLVSIEDLKTTVSKWMQSQLRISECDSLSINKKKIAISKLSDLNSNGAFSERLKSLQKEISGPSDRDTLESVQGNLEGLLRLEEYAIPSNETNQADSELVRLVSFDQDVRFDTIKRFAANRLELIIRMKRRMHDSDLTDSNVLGIISLSIQPA